MIDCKTLRGLLISGLVSMLLALAPARVDAVVDRNIYRSLEHEIEVVFPVDWSVSEQASYPSLLAIAIDRSLGGRLTLAIDTLAPGEKLADCVERNTLALRKVRFKVKQQPQHPTGAMVLQADTQNGKIVVRQAYRHFTGDRVYILTLAAARETMPRYIRPFDDTLRGMAHIGKPAASPEGDDSQGDDIEAAPADPDSEFTP